MSDLRPGRPSGRPRTMVGMTEVAAGLDSRHSARSARPDRAFIRRWLGVVTLGEAAGFLLPAALGPFVMDGSPAVYFPALLAAGAVEGSILGWAQWSVARGRLPALSRARWVGLTAAGAMVAYAIGLLPSTFWDTVGAWPVAVQVVALGLGGIALLLTIGTAQWVELRHHVAHAGRWVLGTAAAWGLALGVFAGVSSPLWQEGQSFGLLLLIGVFAGALMALTMAAVTGWVFLRLSRVPLTPSLEAAVVAAP